MKKGLPAVPFSSLSFFGGTKEELLDRLAVHLEGSPQGESGLWTICTPNPEQFVLAKRDATFRRDLESADWLLPDGAGLVWAINRHQTEDNRLERIAGREVLHDLLELAAKKKYRVFLLGGNKGSGELIAKHYKLNWQGDDGPRTETSRVLEKIAAYQPDLLFVAYGAPWQERWIMENKVTLEKLQIRIAMAVGGAFEYESGQVPSVSSFVQTWHLEWLQRLITQPWRWKRQLRGLQFFIDVLLGKYD